MKHLLLLNCLVWQIWAFDQSGIPRLRKVIRLSKSLLVEDNDAKLFWLGTSRFDISVFNIKANCEVEINKIDFFVPNFSS
ncbi:21016_t:CDS:1, partial [Gigaspora rosea]